MDNTTSKEGLASFRTNLSRMWGWIAMRGVIGILFGILAFVWPWGTAWALAIAWGAFVLADGVLTVFSGWQIHRGGHSWWPYLFFGLTGAVAGIISLAWPGITILVLVYVVAFWALFGGITQIAAAVRLRKEIEGEWSMILGGVIAVLFGVLLLVRPPGESVLAITWLIGFYAIFTGIFALSLAFRVRPRR